MELDEYNVTLPIQTRFRDTDLLGHINNAVYATYFESGRMEYWARFQGGHDFDNWPFILAHLEIDFLAEAHAGQKLTLGIRVCRIGTRSFDFEYLLVRDEDQQRVARGRSVQVMFDYAAKKSRPVDDETRARLEAFEGGSLDAPG